MGIEVQKSALPTLFHFARVRAASQPHVWYLCKIIEKPLILDSESDAAEAADLYAVPGLDPDRYFKRAGFVGMRGKKQSDYASNYASYLRRPTLYDAMARNIRAGFVGMRG